MKVELKLKTHVLHIRPLNILLLYVLNICFENFEAFL